MNKFLKRLIPITLTILMCFTVSSTYAKNEIVIKMGSIAPDGSPWDVAIKKLSAEWSQITNGEVTIKVYPGGIAGDEADMVRKMRIGQLQGAVLTSVGLSNISPEISLFYLPMYFKNDAELDYILEKNSAKFNAILEKKGFVTISWTKSGWVNFFSKDPAFVPDDIKKIPLAVSANDSDVLQAWRKSGFNAIPLSSNDLLASLQSGMVKAFYAPPLAAAAFQWFALAPNMCSIKIAPLVGGVVVSSKTWKQIPAKYHKPMMESAVKLSSELFGESNQLENKAIETMKKHGLKINEVPADKMDDWYKYSAQGHEGMIGKKIPKALYNDITKQLNEFRKK